MKGYEILKITQQLICCQPTLGLYSIALRCLCATSHLQHRQQIPTKVDLPDKMHSEVCKKLRQLPAMLLIKGGRPLWQLLLSPDKYSGGGGHYRMEKLPRVSPQTLSAFMCINFPIGHYGSTGHF